MCGSVVLAVVNSVMSGSVVLAVVNSVMSGSIVLAVVNSVVRKVNPSRWRGEQLDILCEGAETPGL